MAGPLQPATHQPGVPLEITLDGARDNWFGPWPPPSLIDEGGERRDAAWSYPNPYPAVAGIRGHLAFYPDRVDAIEAEDDPA